MKKKKSLAILLDKKNSWIFKYLYKFKDSFFNKFKFSIFYDYKKIKNFDFVFILSFTRILPDSFIIKNKNVFVIHGSKLPFYRGFAPIQPQILENKNIIQFSLVKLSANEKVDTGIIVMRSKMILNGDELYDEIRLKQINISILIIKKFFKNFSHIKAIKQTGKGFFNKKRLPKDSEIDIKKPIFRQFNLLRIVDNENWPAFFYFRKKKYLIKIFKSKK